MTKFRFIIFLALCFSALITKAQIPAAEFDTRANNLDDIEAFHVGDSIFFSFTDKLPSGLRNKKAFWISPDNTVAEFPAGRLPASPLTAVTTVDDKIHYYYLVKTEMGLMLRFLRQVRGTTTTRDTAFNFTISDEVLALQAQQNTLYLLTYNKNSNNLKVRMLHGNRVSYENDFPLSFELKRHLKSSTGLILNPEITDFEHGSARVKFYAEPGKIIATIDEPFVNKASKTTVIKLKLSTGEQITSSIAGPDDEEFSSFYYDNNLYRILRGHNTLALNIYNSASGDSLFSKLLKKDKTLREQLVYHRVGKTKTSWYITMHDMFDKNPDPAILVQPGTAPDEIRVVFGNTFDEKGHGAVAGFPDPASMLISFVASHTVERLSESPGISNIVYLKGNTQKGFEFEPVKNNTAACVRQVIDEYEISRDSKEKGIDRWYLYLKYKGYIPLKDGALGIYHDKRNRSEKLVLLKYKAAGN